MIILSNTAILWN